MQPLPSPMRCTPTPARLTGSGAGGWCSAAKPEKALQKCKYSPLAPSHAEDWALQPFRDTNMQYKSATPACRDAQQGNACACEICWSPGSQALAKSKDNRANMLVCERCQKCFHCQCLHIPDTTGQDLVNKEWTCPACEHHPYDRPEPPRPASCLRLSVNLTESQSPTWKSWVTARC